MTGAGSFVEVQGTAEGVPFRRDELDALLDLAVAGALSSPSSSTARSTGDRPEPGERAPMTRLLLASRNTKKLAEMRRIVAAGFEVVGLDDVPRLRRGARERRDVRRQRV